MCLLHLNCMFRFRNQPRYLVQNPFVHPNPFPTPINYALWTHNKMAQVPIKTNTHDFHKQICCILQQSTSKPLSQCVHTPLLNLKVKTIIIQTPPTPSQKSSPSRLFALFIVSSLFLSLSLSRSFSLLLTRTNLQRGYNFCDENRLPIVWLVYRCPKIIYERRTLSRHSLKLLMKNTALLNLQS